MKKFLTILALLGMFAVGCTDRGIDDGINNGGNNIEKPDNGDDSDIPKDIFFGIDKDRVLISPDGGSVDIVVYSNYKWEISGTNDWCTPSITKGDANEDGQKVTFSADVAYDDREATFWFRCTDEKIKFVVSQKFKEVIIPDANNSFNIPAEGGVAVISYKTTVDCEVIIPEEAQDWITIAPATRGLVSENINLDIAENTTYSARIAVVKVVAKDNAELAVEYTINQEQNDAVLANGNTEFTIAGREQQITIKHKANVDCDVIIPYEAQDWITISPATRGLSTYSTTLNIAENNSGEERSCVVKVTSQGDNELFAEYTIVQNPICFLYYTSNDGKIVRPYNSSSFGATIISNTYKDGVGVIEFDALITTIGYYAFYYYCTSLTSVTIPDSVTTIGDGAFAYTSLTSVNIPDSVTEIGSCAFQYCSSLKSVTIGDSVTTIGDDAFYYCTSLTSVNIPDIVTTIGDWTFNDCKSLTSITIPEGITSIGDYAFQGCDSLTSVTIPDSVTTIGDSAFYSCNSLTSETIGDSVTLIGSCAFQYCSSLKSVYCKATTPPALDGSSVFDSNGSGRKIYVPTESVEAYKSATRWSEYASAIVGYDFENGVVVE